MTIRQGLAAIAVAACIAAVPAIAQPVDFDATERARILGHGPWPMP